MTFVERTLNNGLRICLEPFDHVDSAACGFMVLTGSRDEDPEREGVSHFLEHMCFKGTATSTWEQINQRFDRLGSRYNAFTSQEKTMYYGWVPEENLLPQIDLLAEMMRSTMPPEEFDTEKKVILEEIAMYRDSLYSCMFDLASKELFPGSPLALSVLGTEDTIGPLTREQMLDYHTARYGPDNMVFVGSGRLDPDLVCRHLEQLTRDWKPTAGGREQDTPQMQRGVAKQQNEKFNQQALMLCYPAPSGAANDPRALALPRIVGGDNSRIFWNVIQAGVCPDAGMFYMGYGDTGVFVLYALCEPAGAQGALDAIREQAQQISAGGAEPGEVARVCNTMRTSTARDGDSPMRRLLQLAGDIQLLGRPLTLGEHLAEIERLKTDDIGELLREYPITGEGLLVSVGPADWP
jgi:predicted Zn-dependent peptidase